VAVDGQFKLVELEGGTWLLTASRSGSAPAFAEIPAGTSGVRLQLLRGGELVGRVRDKRKGSPVAPFTVVVQAKETRTLSVIDPSGAYRFDDLSPGPAVASAIAPGYAPSAEVRVSIPEPGAGSATADFDLSPGGSLTGFVVEKGTDAGIPGALVEVEGTPPSLGVPVRNSTLTDQDGGFVLNGLAESTVGIQASAAAHHARIISLPPIPEGDVTGPLTIELTPLREGEDAGVELAGIGAGLQKSEDVFVVVRVIPNSGAAEVGLAVGDAVTSINGASVKSMTLADAVPLLRGPEGTTVTLVVAKAANPQTTVTLVVPRRVVRG
jgi:membrane-associated protease RseP (regulator of RpoE activity)